jgi:SAM-dependent methyltransferase
MMGAIEAYRDDLAYVHDVGFAGHARHAARFVLECLRENGIAGGLVVDLACGGGLMAEPVANAGYDVLGIDISPAMIERARRRVPGGRFIVGSLLNAELPACAAVTVIGEGINYLFDPANCKEGVAALFQRAFDAMSAGGLLILDSAGPGRIPGSGTAKSHFEGVDWAVLVDSEEDRIAHTLTRRITTFRLAGEHYRRDHEVHRLRLYPEEDVTQMLRGAGFSVRTVRAYGELDLPAGLTGFVARKPEA